MITANLLFMVQNPHQGKVVAEKQLQGSRSLQKKFLSKYFSCASSRNVYLERYSLSTDDCRAAKEKEGQDRSSLLKREWEKAFGGLQSLLLPRKVCQFCMLSMSVVFVYTER